MECASAWRLEMKTKFSVGLDILRVLLKVIVSKTSTGYYYYTLFKGLIARKEANGL